MFWDLGLVKKQIELFVLHEIYFNKNVELIRLATIYRYATVFH